jgi:hypothetical protein
MNWIMWVGVGLVVLLLIALIAPGRKTGSRPGDANRQMTTAEMSDLQRARWDQATEAVIAYRDARGDDIGPARERMLRVADEADPSSQTFEGVAMSERQLLMWQLAAEELRAFVNDALARHPEDQQI